MDVVKMRMQIQPKKSALFPKNHIISKLRNSPPAEEAKETQNEQNERA